jgi:hypothetical protein
MNISERVKVTIQRSGGGVSSLDFGAAMIFARMSDLSTPLEASATKTYKSLEALALDVGADKEAYKAALLWMANNGGEIKIRFMIEPINLTAEFAAATSQWFFAHWYAQDLVTAENVNTLALTAAVTQRPLFITTKDPELVSSIAANEYVFVSYTEFEDEQMYNSAVVAAYLGNTDYTATASSTTAENRTFIGVRGSIDPDLKEKEIAAFIDFNNGGSTLEAMLINTTTQREGVFIADLYDISALANQLQTDLFNFPVNRKIDYSQNGYQRYLLRGAQTLDQFKRNGVLAGGVMTKEIENLKAENPSTWMASGYIILSKKSDVPIDMPLNRKFPAFKVKVNQAFAANSIDAIIEVRS